MEKFRLFKRPKRETIMKLTLEIFRAKKEELITSEIKEILSKNYNIWISKTGLVKILKKIVERGILERRWMGQYFWKLKEGMANVG